MRRYALYRVPILVLHVILFQRAWHIIKKNITMISSGEHNLRGWILSRKHTAPLLRREIIWHVFSQGWSSDRCRLFSCLSPSLGQWSWMWISRDEWMDEQIGADWSLKHLYGSLKKYVWTYLRLLRPTWHLIRLHFQVEFETGSCFPLVGSCFHGCSLEITPRLQSPTYCRRRNGERLRNGRRQEKESRDCEGVRG